ncbi:MAG: 2-oxoglutarate dehydrogenase complex dihydrolipoyllysine-residue succinyltransferase [Spirochaetales bacterium]|jgi:2-oxoglutarate dehydrogenase E2 component (dihydrolipoamide succinyltransferase)|nr:2-oxoglutarate dehydrogenase complex dihydrolipoyllysine-residue succinyltransferase [Spirochaetales bacterium]
MKENISVPKMGESVTSGIIAAWLKADGEAIQEGDELFELETDKATLAVPSTVSGVLKRLAAEGDEVEVGQIVAEIVSDASASARQSAEVPEPISEPIQAEKPEAAAQPVKMPENTALDGLAPSVRRIVVEHGLNPEAISGTGKGGRITKEDALSALEMVLANRPAMAEIQSITPAGPMEDQTRIKMTRLRKRIAENLVSAKHTSAHLTTFNEIDLSAVMEMRAKYRDIFEKKHGIRLGFMSFFVKAAAAALKEYPVANAIIDDDDIVYNNRYNIGVAVSTERGLIVPVVRDADQKGFSEIENEIMSFAVRAKEKKITVDELTGGTFSITNGGVFGSLLSTPIPSPPQSAILGMHTIQKRPVAIDDEVVIRPMMYVAVTYDHRIMDGKDAVSFLVKIKKLVEDPGQMLLDL